MVSKAFRVTLDLVFDCTTDTEFVDDALAEFFEGWNGIR